MASARSCSDILFRLFGWLLIPNTTWDASAGPREITADEHRRLSRRLRVHRKIYGLLDPWGGRVHRLGKSLVIKCGGSPESVRLTEALNMDYVARHTTIPVPRIHDVLSWAGCTYIAMDYVKAPTLRSVWPQLDQQERRDVMRQLRDYIDQLRSLLPPDPRQVQAVDGKSCYDERMGGEYGPYATIDSFNEAWGYKLIPEKYPEHREVFKKVAARSWRIVFAHGDLGPHNLLWRDGKIVAIIDWESAGWLPEYWDYTRTFKAIYPDNPADQEWWKMLQDFIPCYPDELEVEICVDNTLERY